MTLITNLIVTAYLATGHLDASGHKPVAGLTCAASRQYPFKTVIEIDGRKWIVTDRLNKRFDNRVDLFFGNDRKAALQFGRQKKSVKIITP